MFTPHKFWTVLIVFVTLLVIASTMFGYWCGQHTVGGGVEEDETELTVRFLNIGHGLSVLIQTPDGKNVLIDAAVFDTFKSTTQFLEDINVTKLDAFIIKHPHPDHVSYAVEVLDMCDVESIYMPGNADNLEPELWSSVMNATIAEGRPVFNDTTISSGDYPDISDEVIFQVMRIDANASLINDSCIVIRMDYKDTSFLFTADMEWAAELAMMNFGLDLDVDILQVAHHGVDSGTSTEFLNALSPEIAIVSCGIGYGVPQVPQPGWCPAYMGFLPIPPCSTVWW